MNRPSDSNPRGQALEASSSENAIARSRNAALNSNVIAVYEDDFVILGQDKTILSTNRLMEILKGMPQGNAHAIAHSRNAALNSIMIATYKDSFSQGKTHSNSTDGIVETLLTYGSEKSSVDKYLERGAKLFGSAQRNASPFCRTQSNATSGSTQSNVFCSALCDAMSFQLDAIVFGSTQCDTTLFDSSQRDAISFDSIQSDATSLGDSFARLQRNGDTISNDSIVVPYDMLSYRSSSSRRSVSEGGDLDDNDFQTPTFLFKDIKCPSFREGEKCT